MSSGLKPGTDGCRGSSRKRADKGKERRDPASLTLVDLQLHSPACFEVNNYPPLLCLHLPNTAIMSDWLVGPIVVSLWALSRTRHLVFRGPERGPQS